MWYAGFIGETQYVCSNPRCVNRGRRRPPSKVQGPKSEVVGELLRIAGTTTDNRRADNRSNCKVDYDGFCLLSVVSKSVVCEFPDKHYQPNQVAIRSAVDGVNGR